MDARSTMSDMQSIESFSTLTPSKTQTCIFALIALATMSGSALRPNTCHAESPLVIDFNPDNGRGDIVTPGAMNWPVKEAREDVRTVNDLQVRVECLRDGDKLSAPWWKAGFDVAATLTSDGVSTSAPGGGLRITIAGLTDGQHRLVLWHNGLSDKAYAGHIQVVASVGNDKGSAQGGTFAAQPPIVVRPSHRVLHHDDSAYAMIQCAVERNQVLRIDVTTTDDRESVILNGLSIDSADLSRQIRHATPADQDFHVAADPKLMWRKPLTRRTDGSFVENENVVAYHVYQGLNENQLRSATPASSEYLGRSIEPTAQTTLKDCLVDCFWRVDCEFADGSIEPGILRRFKIRHDAFPGAEGHGRYAIGGRGGRVIEVTNLDDHGPAHCERPSKPRDREQSSFVWVEQSSSRANSSFANHS